MILLQNPGGSYSPLTSISAANTSAQVVGRTVVITSPYTISADTTLRGDCTWKIVKGGLLTIASGVTLTFQNQPQIPDGVQAFAGSGTVAGLLKDNPEMFGSNITPGTTDMSTAYNNAVKALVPGGTLRLGPTTYKMNTLPDPINKSINIIGQNGLNDAPITMLDFSDLPAGAGAGAGIDLVRDTLGNAQGSTVKNIYLLHNGATANQYIGLRLHGQQVEGYLTNYLTQCTVENVKSVGWLTGFFSTLAYQNTFRHCVGSYSHKSDVGTYGYGFYVDSGATSTIFDRCWALSNAGDGYYVLSGHHITFNACAANNNGGAGSNGLVSDTASTGYKFIASQGISMNGCGAELNKSTAVYVDGSTVGINGFESVGNGALATAATTLDALYNSNVSISGLTETAYPSTTSSTASLSARFQSNLGFNGVNNIQLTNYRDLGSTFYGPGRLWVAGDTMTVTGSTTFTVDGDQTTKYPVGTPLRILVATGLKKFDSVRSVVESRGVTTITTWGDIIGATAFEYVPIHCRVDYKGVNKTSFGNNIPTEAVTWSTGDVVYNLGANYSQYTGWKNVSGGAPGTWKGFGWMPAKGVTASRPATTGGLALGVNDIGITYFDTTLDADGLPIFWNGAKWIKADGSDA